MNDLQIVSFDARFDRTDFDCGAEPLNRYLREQVGQDVRRRVAACFVAITHDDRIAAYYTLASASIPVTDLPTSIRKKLPRYPTVPAVRLGRLAVDVAFSGQGLGGTLLADAITRTLRSEIATYAMMVNAKDEAAAAFYRHHGFIAMLNATMTLFLPLAKVRPLIAT